MHVNSPKLVSLSLHYKDYKLLPLLLRRYEVDFEYPNLFMTNQELTTVVII